MRFKFYILAFAGIIVASNAQRIKIEHKNFTSLDEALKDAESFILKFNETFNFPSLAFGLAVKGKPVMKKVWGRADLENNVFAKLSTKYRLGKQQYQVLCFIEILIFIIFVLQHLFPSHLLRPF